MTTKTNQSSDLDAQRDYVAELESRGFGYDLAVGDAFVRGMREIGYKSTSYAVAELVDNSIQAGATRVDIVFGFDGGAKPTQVAVIDNGHGMEPSMLRLALIWGATHRENDGRKGFGRFGYGLPSASVSQARRVDVYAKIQDGNFHSAYLDVEEIADGKWTRGDRIQMPAASQEMPPRFVLDYIDENPDIYPQGLEHGTVVVWDKLDKVDFRTRDKLRNHLLTDLGVVYRNYLRDTSMTVDGVEVEPCDPLFLTPGFRYYDLDDDRAIAVGDLPTVVEVADKHSGEVIGEIRIRYARFPSSFFRRPEAKATHKPPRSQINERLDVADAHNGIIFSRLGRQIDVLRPPRWITSINSTTDRFWMVEVDFDATLDEEFAIPTTKQQIVPSERIWNMLVDKAGLKAAISQMRSDYEKEAAEIRGKSETEDDKKRASEEAMERASRFKTRRSTDELPERQEEADDNLRREVERRSRESGVPAEVVERELVAEQRAHPYRVATEDLPGAPFFRPEQQGAQKVLYLNVAHRFYRDLYAGPLSTPRQRSGLEVMLWALGEAEIDAIGDRRTYYETERVEWSRALNASLAQLEEVEEEAEEDEDEALPSQQSDDSAA